MSVRPPATIRRAHRADLAALVMLEEATFAHDRVSGAQYRHHVVSRSAAVIVAVQGRHLVGAALVFFRRGADVARLYSLATAAQARGRGIGRALLRSAEAAARHRGCHEMRLEVRLDNRAAIALYAAAGYMPIGKLPAYYEDGSDGLRYGKALRDPRPRAAPRLHGAGR